jgi:hypothetical protein
MEPAIEQAIIANRNRREERFRMRRLDPFLGTGQFGFFDHFKVASP